jgi:RND superfamily putative drug exporter
VWSATHRKRAIIGWFTVVAITAVVGGMLGTKTADNEGNGQSGRVDTFLRGHFPKSSNETILLQARHGSLARNPDYAAAVRDVTTSVTAVPHVYAVHAPASATAGGAISKDGRSALVTLELAKHGSIDRLLASTAAAAHRHPSLLIQEFGDASANKALSDTLGKDFSRAETLSIPITLLILVLAFGALVAAGLPMLLGLSAVAATLGLVGVVSQWLPMDGAISSVVLLIGLAVGVDYSLFYLRREREERAAGASREQALETAAATSGHAIIVSGLTVMIAMAGMFLAGSRVFTSFAVGTIAVVAVSVVGSLTVLPAMLAALGPRVDKGRIPFLHRLARRRRAAGGRRAGATAGGVGSRIWSVVLGGVVRRPLISAVASAGVLIALAVPVLGMHTSLPTDSSLPHNLSIVKTYERIQRAFPGGPEPAIVGIQATDVRSAEVQAGVHALLARAARTPGLLEPVATTISTDHRAEMIKIPIAGSGNNAASNAAVERLRALVPGTVGRLAGVQAGVTGDTAGDLDFGATMDAHLPIVFAFVLGMAFLLLLITFRSIVIPLQAITLNLLSVGAAYGVLVLVFQDGHGHSLLGFQGRSAITSWLPLFMFVVLFGLSMDYHVFILSRVREAFDRGLDAGEATLTGVKRTAGVVTSAAVVMVAVFAIFGTLDEIDFKQMGVGLSAAILIDATIIRGVLLPSTLALLGDRAWYLPGWLGFLSSSRHGPAARPHIPSPECAPSWPSSNGARATSRSF